MSKDSRRDPRAKILSMTVRYKSATVAEFVENHSYDVSRGGLFIRTPSPFPTGTLIKFEVRIADEQQVMTGVGRVTWRRETDRGNDNPAGMGVKFIKIDDESVRLIDGLVKTRSRPPGTFEQGAAEQGIKLSDPPPNVLAPTDDRSSSRPPPASDMLDQSSELLKTAVGSLRPSPPPADEIAEDRVTLPTGSEALPAVGVKSAFAVASAPASEADDDDDDDGSETATDAEESTSKSDPPGSRGKSKGKKKGSKKKKKFKYSNIPSPKTSLRPVAGTTPGVEAAASQTTLTTTPPKRRARAAADAAGPNWMLWGVLLVIALAVGLYWLNREEPTAITPEPEPNPSLAEAIPTPEPPVTATAPATTTESTAEAEQPDPEATQEATEPEALAGAADTTDTDSATDTDSDSDTEAAPAPKRKAPVKKKPRPKPSAKPEPSEPAPPTDTPTEPTPSPPPTAPAPAEPTPAPPPTTPAPHPDPMP